MIPATWNTVNGLGSRLTRGGPTTQALITSRPETTTPATLAIMARGEGYSRMSDLALVTTSAPVSAPQPSAPGYGPGGGPNRIARGFTPPVVSPENLPGAQDLDQFDLQPA